MSAYTGIYTQRLADNSIISVQVKDEFGHENVLDPQTYISRNIQPALGKLPSKEEYFKMKQQ